MTIVTNYYRVTNANFLTNIPTACSAVPQQPTALLLLRCVIPVVCLNYKVG